MLIKTVLKSARNGAGNIVATHTSNGKRKQRTVRYDHSQSREWNHGNAAGELALAMELPWSDKVLHDSTDDGQHLFLWGTDALIEIARSAVK